MSQDPKINPSLGQVGANYTSKKPLGAPAGLEKYTGDIWNNPESMPAPDAGSVFAQVAKAESAPPEIKEEVITKPAEPEAETVSSPKLEAYTVPSEESGSVFAIPTDSVFAPKSQLVAKAVVNDIPASEEPIAEAIPPVAEESVAVAPPAEAEIAEVPEAEPEIISPPVAEVAEEPVAAPPPASEAPEVVEAKVAEEAPKAESKEEAPVLPEPKTLKVPEGATLSKLSTIAYNKANEGVYKELMRVNPDAIKIVHKNGKKDYYLMAGKELMLPGELEVNDESLSLNKGAKFSPKLLMPKKVKPSPAPKAPVDLAPTKEQIAFLEKKYSREEAE